MKCCKSLTNNVNGLRQLRSLPTTADINIIRTWWQWDKTQLHCYS